ncbi:hypothetical protein GOP47_0026922 [Adiantum capillus-veneris]|nr:hypothetical protein GOP47_0026922 [Adiantum capillus-veneris]
MLSLNPIHARRPTHPELRQFRKATMTLLEHIEAAIDNEHDMQKQELEEKQMEMQQARDKLAKEHVKCRKLKKKLANHRKRALAESERQASLLRQATVQSSKQSALFEREKEALEISHRQEKESWKALLEKHVKQIEKERQQVFCPACNKRPRDAVVIPCMHLEYCSECLLRHRAINRDTCPKCNGPIRGICMSTHGASP